MLKKLLKYILLLLFVVNLPTVVLNNFGATFGTLISYSSFLFLIVYYILFAVGRKPNYWMLYLGLAYFIISGLQIYTFSDEKVWLVGILKYIILMIFGNGFFQDVSKKEMIFFLLIGALSVLVNGFFMPSDYGRASGFYYNANPAGLACLLGYAFSYCLKQKTLRQVLQLIFTIAGIVTFSRTFIIVWIIVNLVSIKKSRKNIKIFILGILGFVSLFVLGELLNLGGERFNTLKSAISSDSKKTQLDKDSRTGTWSLFYEDVLDGSLLGNGYGSFQGNGLQNIGVHNTYLLIIGESGIIPFLIFLIMIMRLTKKAWKHFEQDETLFYTSIILVLYLLTLHDFFEYPFMLAVFLFWFNQTKLASKKGEYENFELEAKKSILIKSK